MILEVFFSSLKVLKVILIGNVMVVENYGSTTSTNPSQLVNAKFYSTNHNDR